MASTPVSIDLQPRSGAPAGAGAAPREADRLTPPDTQARPRAGPMVELDAAPVVLPSMGGVASGGSVGAGVLAIVHGAYRLASGPWFGLAVGGLFLSQSRDDRPFSLVPTGEVANPGTLDHDLSLRAGLVGATAATRFGDRTSLRLRLLVGGVFGSVRDSRKGSFQSETGSYQTPELSHSSGATFLCIAPEAGVGRRFAERFEISAGVTLPVLLALGRARWENDQLVSTGTAAASFPDEDLTAGVIVAIGPGVGLLYEF
jgi:hypothetical protein